MMPSIDRLPDLLAALPGGTGKVFNRIFNLEEGRSELKLPGQMLPWVRGQFGHEERVKQQTIIRVTNLITGESSIYNPLRSQRPHNFKRARPSAATAVARDIFADPLNNTPEDVFGRIKGKHCITACNIAKYALHHGVVIFNNSGPLDFGCSEVADYLETGWKWLQSTHQYDREARYGLFLWNCTNRAGASIPHGHAQVVLGRGRHYGKAEQLHRACVTYRQNYGADYFADLFNVHEALGLGWHHGNTRIMSYLAALKQNEVMLLSDKLDDNLKEGIYGILSGFRDKLNVKSFNVGLAFPPFGDQSGWEGFPLVARIVDRGDTADLSSDIGAMEFYGASVVSADPFHTAMVLRNGLDQAIS